MKLTPHQKFKKEVAALRIKMLKMRETMKDTEIAKRLNTSRQAVNYHLGAKHQPLVLTLNGKTLPLVEWARAKGLSTYTLRSRIYHAKWPVEKALNTPARQYKRNESD